MLAFSIILGLLIRSSAGQASVGQECWSSANGVVSGGCASGTQCGPWLPNGGSWNGNDAWYCIKSGTNALADGASCNYDSKIGYCSSGTCCSGVCGSCTTTSTTSTTTGTGSTDTTTTTAFQCSANGGEVCDDTQFPQTYPKTCCEGLTCQAVTGSTRTKMCGGSSVPENGTCVENSAHMNATCASPLVCVSGVCTNFTDDPSCATAGLTGYNLCYNGDLSVAVKNSRCCAYDAANNPGAGVYCIPSEDAGVSDRFCMPYGLEEGDACGATTAAGYAGLCGANMGCISGVCATTASTSTITSTTTTSTTTTTVACSAAGTACWANSAPVAGVTCCSGQCDGDFGIPGASPTNNCL